MGWALGVGRMARENGIVHIGLESGGRQAIILAALFSHVVGWAIRVSRTARENERRSLKNTESSI